MSSSRPRDLPIEWEAWCWEVLRDGCIGEAELGAQLPRVRRLVDLVGPRRARGLLVDSSLQGYELAEVLDLAGV